MATNRKVMVNAYSYIRMSTQQQLSGDSLRHQLEASREYAKKHDLNLDETLRREGVKTARNPSLLVRRVIMIFRKLCWNLEEKKVAAFFRRPIDRVSMKALSHGFPVTVTFWQGLSGLRIVSVVTKIGEREEIGTLKFEIVQEMIEGELIFPTPIEPGSKIEIYKIYTDKNGVYSESGIEISGKNEVSIQCGVYPCTLYISGIGDQNSNGEPEFFVEDYKKKIIDV